MEERVDDASKPAAFLQILLAQQPWSLWWLQARRVARIESQAQSASPGRRAGSTSSPSAPPSLSSSTRCSHAHSQYVHERRHQRARRASSSSTTSASAVFFGCLGIFSRLIRGEMIERSLHFYLLSPVRREVLLLAKFVAGSISAVILFGSAIIADFALIYVGLRPGRAGLRLQRRRPRPTGSLSCHRGPRLPRLRSGLSSPEHDVPQSHSRGHAGLRLGSDQSRSCLRLLQKISVASYLRHLMPITVPGEGIFALLTVETEPVSALGCDPRPARS